jgi:hypothetical protein
MFASKKLKASRQTTAAAAGALTEAITLSQTLLAENVRLREELQTVRLDLLESLNKQLELRQQLDAADKRFLESCGVEPTI